MPIRQIKKSRISTPEEKFSEQLWLEAKRKKAVESVETQVIMKLTQKEANKCRYVIIDMNYRMAECYIHRDKFSHGVKMFPPHLWDLHADGTVWHRASQKDKWKQWSANVKENVQRLPKAT